MEIFLDVFKCLIVSLVLIKFLLWQQHHFCLFQLVSCLSAKWICYGARSVYFTVPPGRRGTLFFLRAQIYTRIHQHNHPKDLNPCLSLYYYDEVIVELAIWASFSLRDSQQITFVILNRFCLLSNLPPFPSS